MRSVEMEELWLEVTKKKNEEFDWLTKKKHVKNSNALKIKTKKTKILCAKVK